MKAYFVLCFTVVAFEAIHAQVIRSIAPGLINGGCGCGCNSIAPIIAPISSCGCNSIAPIIAPISPCGCNSIAPIVAPISPCASNIIPPCSSIYPDVISPYYGSNIIAPAPSTIIQQPSVASSLADTLSLLTVSSLLAETLPLSSNVIMAPSCGCGGCGYGGCGYGGCGYGGYVY